MLSDVFPHPRNDLSDESEDGEDDISISMCIGDGSRMTSSSSSCTRVVVLIVYTVSFEATLTRLVLSKLVLEDLRSMDKMVNMRPSI